MRKFDYSFLNNGLLPANFVNLISDIASLNTLASIRKKQHTQIFTEFESIARVQSIKSCNTLIGNVISDERINAIVNQNSKPQNQNEVNIAQYYDVLIKINLDYDHIDFSEQDIEHLQSMMSSEVHEQAIVDLPSISGTSFRPLTEAEAIKAMHQLEIAYRKAKNDPDINKLLLIPCVILDYICIHLFREGNGKMARLLSLLLLNKFGYDAGKYVSIENQINNCKSRYHDAFIKSAVGWDTNQNNYFPFIESFLFNLRMCYKELDDRFSVIGSRKITKKARIEAIVLNSLKPLSKADICRYLPHVSPTTVEATLGTMVKNGIIKRLGSARASKYIKA